MKNCCIFDYPDATTAGKNFKHETVESFSTVDYTYNWNERTQKLVKCTNCGALFLFEHFEFKAMRYEDDDDYYSFWYPVSTREEALEYSKFDGHKLKSNYPGTYLQLINGRWQWVINKTNETEELK